MSSSFATIRAALGLAALLGGLGLGGGAWAQQSKLPACPVDPNVRWHKCFGAFAWPNGQKYVGEYQDNMRHGQGTQTLPDGQKYVGEFRNSNRTGQGTLYSPNGIVLKSGIWANDKFSRSGPSTATVPPPNPSVAVAPPPPPTPSKASSGTAFRIASGQFVTSHHVINGCNWLTVDGKLGGRLLASDQTRDLALVSISNDSGPIASIRTTRIQLNESITAAGFPLEGAFSGIAITNGTISRLSGLRGDTGEVQISAPVQPGNSGGPLLDTAGTVIGVVSSKLNALKMAGVSGDIPQNVNFAINGSSLRSFLDAKNVNYKEAGNEQELTGVQIAVRASAFTVLIECQR
jgi:S1-C subfamily serine protease